MPCQGDRQFHAIRLLGNPVTNFILLQNGTIPYEKKRKYQNIY